MRELFYFFSKSHQHGLKITISHHIQHRIYFQYSNGKIKNVEYINSLDREKLAKNFLLSIGSTPKRFHPKYNLINTIPYEVFVEHVAIYIDLIIIRHYCNLLNESTFTKGKIRGISDVEGLIYYFPQNYTKKVKTPSKSPKTALNQEDREYKLLNKPYEKLNDYTLYRILLKDCELNCVELKKQQKDMSRLEVLRLLHYFYYKRPLKEKARYLKEKA